MADLRILWTFLLLGLGGGGLYALSAIGLVLVYRGSRVINFAHGAMGMFGAYIFWFVRDQHGKPFFVAFIAGVAASALLGLLTHVLVMRRLRDSSNLARMIATLGIMATLQAAVALLFPQGSATVEPFLPHSAWHIFGAAVGQDRIIIFLIVVALAGLLGTVYHYSSFGRATTAVATNRDSAAGLGLSPDLIASVNWAIGAGLSGMATIFIVPISGFQVTELTLLVIPVLAAAVVGKFSSFPLTLLGGLLIGVAQSEATRFSQSSGWPEAIPFLLVAAILLLQGRVIVQRGDTSAKLPSVGSGHIRPLPLLITVVGLLSAIWFWLSPQWIGAITTQMTIAIVLLSLVVVTGYAGQLSLVQLELAGLGALFAGHLMANFHFSFLLATLTTVIVAIPIGVIVGLTGLRTRGVDLAIVTLGLAVALDSVIFGNLSLTGGSFGISPGRLTVLGIDISDIRFPERYATVALAALVVMVLAVGNVRRGRIGRQLLAIRYNERAAASLGISVIGGKLYAFTLGTVVAAIGGILIAFQNQILNFSQFSTTGSVQTIVQGMIGGIGWLAGPAIGSSFQTGGLGSQALGLLGSGVASYIFLFGGLLLLINLLFAPDGVASVNAALLGALRAKLPTRFRARSKGQIEAVHKVRTHRVTSRQLDVRDLKVQFGGVVALNGVSMTVTPGTVVGLIGPNGAGKTTLLDAVTGFVRVTGGSILLDNHSVGGWSPTRRAREGIGRSFQALELFDDMTVLDNIRAASEPKDVRSYLFDVIHPSQPKLTPAAQAAIREFHLEDSLNRRPAELNHGKRRLVSIARAVAGEPSLLLLDEPAAGLNDAEAMELGRVIRWLAEQWGMAVLLIEHNVSFVMQMCDRIYAVNFGQPIAEGLPEEIRQHAGVIDAYLGTEAPELAIGAE